MTLSHLILILSFSQSEYQMVSELISIILETPMRIHAKELFFNEKMRSVIDIFQNISLLLVKPILWDILENHFIEVLLQAQQTSCNLIIESSAD